MKFSLLVAGALLLISVAREVHSRSAGPPLVQGNFDRICTQMLPNHGGTAAQTGNGGYTITTNLPGSGTTGYSYTAGQTYIVTLSGSETFTGFLVIAHVPGQNGMLLGTFTPQNSNQQTLDCDAVGASTQATVTHSNSALTQFSSMTFSWVAPTGADGTVDFRYTVVRAYSTFYVLQSAAANDPTPLLTDPPPTTPSTTAAPPSPTTDEGVATTMAPLSTTAAPPSPTTDEGVATTMAPPSTTAAPPSPTTDEGGATTTAQLSTTAVSSSPTTDQEPTTTTAATSQSPTTMTTPLIGTTDPPISGNLIAPTTSPENYRLTFRNPPGCAPSDCDIFVGIDTNSGDPGFLDIYLEGKADGWVAVGFTKTQSMNLADVVACNRDPGTGLVEALDSWNTASYSNVVDNVQDVMLFSGSYNLGRIMCSVAKRALPSVGGESQDFSLNEEYFILYGRRRANSVSDRLIIHESGTGNNPTISSATFNPLGINASTSPVTTTTEPTSGSTTEGESLVAPNKAPEDYELSFRDPPDCAPEECDVFVGIDINSGDSGYLDIYLEGVADGWVAVGFTETASMPSADVVACNRDPLSGMVSALDTWNINGYGNQVDNIQDVVLFSSNYAGSRITCSVAKKIAPSGTGQDLDLNNDYFILYGRRRGDSNSASLRRHEMGAGQVPRISTAMYNPVPSTDQPTDNNMPDTTSSNGISIIAPNTAAENYRLTFRNPPNCAPEECDVFVGIDTNSGDPGFLDIYLEGMADGWVAVGFTKSPNMNLADVVACNRDPVSGMVEALDAWNVQVYGNQRDTIQDVYKFSGNHENGRITCSVSKKIAPSGTGEDFNLNEEYHILYGRRRGESNSGFLFRHETGPGNNPSFSVQTVNPVTAGGSVGVFPRQQLLRFHGIIMLIAWPLLAVTGIFFAAWMKPALPNGEWFQVHRALLLTSMFVGALGFAVAFTANYPSGLISFTATGSAHFGIGFIVMFLHIANPLIAACRCEPTGKYRWLFDVLHGSVIGVIAEIGALFNVALGTILLFGGFSPLFWVYIIFCLVNFLFFKAFVAKSSDKLNSWLKKADKEKVQGFSLIPLGGYKQQQEVEETATKENKPSKKVPSKDAPIRWAIFAIFLVTSVLLLSVCIALIAALDN